MKRCIAEIFILCSVLDLVCQLVGYAHGHNQGKNQSAILLPFFSRSRSYLSLDIVLMGWGFMLSSDVSTSFSIGTYCMCCAMFCIISISI